MPITFADGWNQLNLAKLKRQDVAAGVDPAEQVGDIARFWLAKTRMKKLGPLKVGELDKLIAPLEAQKKAKELDPSQKFTGKMAADLKAAGDERATIQNALDREKVTSAMVKKFSP